MPIAIVLASGSPRRRELLGRLGLVFDVVVPGIEEARLPGEDPDAYVGRIAEEKAAAAAVPGAVVVAADTAVVVDGAVLGKPDGPEAAAAMLRLLAGREHWVVTAVCVARDGRVMSHLEGAIVAIRPMTESEIAWYVACGEPLDKAGAYAAQGIGALFVTRIEGDPTAVMGMPLGATLALLRAAGVDPIG